ncbi:DUF1146 family protein [Paenibacillus apiarius]|uniref:DUF1146 family protein n=1 Tax=Paenibacillus apiarius TaxID=46240 RepID=A0ABT4DSS7_9BACL|nr:DUF1146 family protein [Paenibacillus apiarius]MBN3523910.1 DUF1146 domain-containing protein [Paenibacillus apiarius]MCY9514223.1 DUF1146 family protein [Paenibacillus apiarius]MCY9520346.1 DUF1146 family protein [Paenibacillus apiarius]MCY9554757.1 DUF1146 family protein [Paenibacillus apiarius]MCY9557374.1 DUF1146 family protein [Paenibacillus apiarius]
MDDSLSQVTSSVGWSGMAHMLITLVCIALSWWSLQHLKIDLFIRHPQSPQGKMLHLILAIIVGRAVAQFFLDYWGWTQSLRFLF